MMGGSATRNATSVRGGPPRAEERPGGDREQTGTGEGEPIDERMRGRAGGPAEDATRATEAAGAREPEGGPTVGINDAVAEKKGGGGDVWATMKRISSWKHGDQEEELTRQRVELGLVHPPVHLRHEKREVITGRGGTAPSAAAPTYPASR
jgi:hypothetical protein